MWIRQVTAHAFGPFKGETIDLAPGLTVVIGPNEAGKSSWHAAIYAGLCGMRRGRGRRHRDDELFASRHAPWNGGPWEVSSVVTLADGRTIEIRHDLAAQAASSARDLDLGRDVTNEIIHDGSPDGSVWLGLDRRAFSAVACVRQAEILAVTQHADTLQEHLQRAAATAGADETAAAALAALADYRREHVGLDRANSTKPLRTALERVYVATERHRAAVDAHSDWLRREGEVAKLERQARSAEHQLRLAKAAVARRAANELAERVAKLDELQRLYPQAPPPLAADDDLAARVATAIHAWHQRPEPVALEGPTADELEQQLSELPELPPGDLDPHPSVVAARRTLAEVVTRADSHNQHAPTVVTAPNTGGATADQLEEFARELSIPVPDIDPRLESEVERLRDEAERQEAATRRTGQVITLTISVVALVAAGVLGALSEVVAAAVAGATALIFGAVTGILAVRRRRRFDPTVEADLQAAEARLEVAREQTAEGIRRQSRVIEQVEQLGLDPHPTALRQAIHQIERASQAAGEYQRWETDARTLDEQLHSAKALLVEALQARQLLGQDVGTEADAQALLAAADDYEQSCRDRRQIAEQVKVRPALETQLEARRQAEERAQVDADRIARIETGLVAAATEAGVLAPIVAPTDHPNSEEIVELLHRWEQQRATRRSDRERAQHGWHQLQALLDGRTLDDWQAEATRLADAAAQLGQGLDETQIESMPLGSRPEDLIHRLDNDASVAKLALAEARRELAVRAESIDPVAEAAEEVAAAEAELARVRHLDQVLTLTSEFMETAQQRVHRDLAPVLAERVRPRLSQITGGRYRDVIIDPETLTVQVRDPEGRLRDAAYLSQGTAEQVYLLLRVAMAEILTTESSPLLLDDVTVQSDAKRTEAVLGVLHQVSRDHQIVLFSQEDEVAEWARRHLGNRDSLVEL